MRFQYFSVTSLALCSLLLVVPDVIGDARSSQDEALWDILNECLNGLDSVSTCLKLKVLSYYDHDMEEVNPRSLSKKDESKVDRILVKRFQRLATTRGFEVQLPEFFFQGATLVFPPGKAISDFDVEFPEHTKNEAVEVASARDISKEKMLLPLLLMLKMKLKMITPIMLTLVSIKATKALLMSKLALMLVIGFLASQLLKKVGMQLPLFPHTMEPANGIAMSMMTTPPPSYGPPQPPPPPPSSSYGEPPSSWEPSSASSNVYAKTWDPHQMAYSGYANNHHSASNTNQNVNQNKI